jgi:hypothetical protein
MELVKKYWWVLLIAAFFIKMKQSDGSKKSIAKTVVDEIDKMLGSK